MIERIVTPNILEVVFMLDRHHRVVDVATATNWYGIPELTITMEGDNAELDHMNFLRHGELRDLTQIPRAFVPIQRLIWLKKEIPNDEEIAAILERQQTEAEKREHQDRSRAARGDRS